MKDNKTGSGRPRKRRLKSALAIYETSTPLSQTRYVGRAHGADFPLRGGGGGGGEGGGDRQTRKREQTRGVRGHVPPGKFQI